MYQFPPIRIFLLALVTASCLGYLACAGTGSNTNTSPNELVGNRFGGYPYTEISDCTEATWPEMKQDLFEVGFGI